MGVNGYDFVVTSLNWGGQASEWVGEIVNWNDHFQGSAGMPVAFYGIRRLNNGVWLNVNPNQVGLGSQHPNGQVVSFSNNAYYLWDTRG
jgi:hypothetical protein